MDFKWEERGAFELKVGVGRLGRFQAGILLFVVVCSIGGNFEAVVAGNVMFSRMDCMESLGSFCVVDGRRLGILNAGAF